MPFQIVRVIVLHEYQEIVVAEFTLRIIVEQARPLRIGKSNIINFNRSVVSDKPVLPVPSISRGTQLKAETTTNEDILSRVIARILSLSKGTDNPRTPQLYSGLSNQVE